MMGPDGEVPALCSPLLYSQHSAVEGKPSLRVAMGFYNPENESQRHPCLSGEQGHVTAQEITPWEPRLVKEGRKPKEAGLVWGCVLGYGKAGGGCASCMLPTALNRYSRFFPSLGVGPQCFGEISLHGVGQRSCSVPEDSWASLFTCMWGDSGLREPEK